MNIPSQRSGISNLFLPLSTPSISAHFLHHHSRSISIPPSHVIEMPPLLGLLPHKATRLLITGFSALAPAASEPPCPNSEAPASSPSGDIELRVLATPAITNSRAPVDLPPAALPRRPSADSVSSVDSSSSSSSSCGLTPGDSRRRAAASKIWAAYW
jgi:hypothetical protein